MGYNEYLFIDYGLPFLGLLITAIAQIIVTSNYNKYRIEHTRKNITGASVARQILDKNGLKEVKIEKISGNLTDHYNPKNKTVSLSEDIYDGTSIASISVAAHECGHAIQHKEGYIFLKIRSFLVPFTNFSTKIGYFVVVIGLIFNLLTIRLNIHIYPIVNIMVMIIKNLLNRKIHELKVFSKLDKML